MLIGCQQTDGKGRSNVTCIILSKRLQHTIDQTMQARCADDTRAKSNILFATFVCNSGAEKWRAGGEPEASLMLNLNVLQYISLDHAGRTLRCWANFRSVWFAPFSRYASQSSMSITTPFWHIIRPAHEIRDLFIRHHV
jgi:hypothetical protein